MSSLATTIANIAHNLLPGSASYYLVIPNSDIRFSVVNFAETNAISQTYRFDITATCDNSDIDMEKVLNRQAYFDFAVEEMSFDIGFGKALPINNILRSTYGIITRCTRLQHSGDETRYQLSLEPTLTRLKHSKTSAIYQDRSVIEVITSLLKEKYGFLEWQYDLKLQYKYAKREMIIQWQESDFSFIERLLSEVGINYLFRMDSQLKREIIVFFDGGQGYDHQQPILPLSSPSGLHDDHKASVWDVQIHQQMVTEKVQVKDYNYRQGYQNLQTEANLTPNTQTHSATYYEFGDYIHLPYERMAATDDADTKELAETSKGYATRHHLRLLAAKTRITGHANAANLDVGQVLKLSGRNVPKIFAQGVLIIQINSKGARDASYSLEFEAVPYQGFLPYLSPLIAKPVIHGAFNAHISTRDAANRYAEIDQYGRYRVRFDFDQSTHWQKGQESCYLRLARNYGGDNHGLHFPLRESTPVLVSFENGDINKPFISQILHDSRHEDVVTAQNYRRNILKTPANNLLLLDDTDKKEFIQLSTEHSGKSQLNLGQLVDDASMPKPRGQGFELRTDAHGAIRAAKGLLLSAEEQAQGEGQQLAMQAVKTQLEQALALTEELLKSARQAQAEGADTAEQQQLQQNLTELQQAGIVAYAPSGIALSSEKNLQFSSGNHNVSVTSGKDTEISAWKKFTVAAGEKISLYAKKLGMKLFASQGDIELQAQKGQLLATAQQDVTISSTQGIVTINASKGLVLNCNGTYIKLADGTIEVGGKQNFIVKMAHVQKAPAGNLPMTPPHLPEGNSYGSRYTLVDENNNPLPGTAYSIKADGQTVSGFTDEEGNTLSVFTRDVQPAELHQIANLPTEKKVMYSQEYTGAAPTKIDYLPEEK